MSYRVVIIGAGFGGLGMAIALKQAGIDDFIVLERAEDRRRDLARQHLSRAALRCAVAAVLLLVSATRRWSRRYPPQAEILGLPARGRGRVRAARTCGSARRSRPRASTGTARAGRSPSPTARRWRRRPWSAPSGSSAGPALPGHPRPGRLRRAVLPLGAVGPRRPPRRPPGRRDRHRRQRDPVRAGDRDAGRHVDVYQRTRAVRAAQGGPAIPSGRTGVFDRLPAVRKAERGAIFLYGELLTRGLGVLPERCSPPRWRCGGGS